MKVRTVLSRANKIVSYLQRKRKTKLYQQWIERADLPPEAAPKEEFAGDIIPKIDKKQLRLPLLYVLLGASLMILCVGTVLLIVYSC